MQPCISKAHHFLYIRCIWLIISCCICCLPQIILFPSSMSSVISGIFYHFFESIHIVWSCQVLVSCMQFGLLIRNSSATYIDFTGSTPQGYGHPTPHLVFFSLRTPVELDRNILALWHALSISVYRWPANKDNLDEGGSSIVSGFSKFLRGCHL